MLETPVLFLVFNRPDVTRRVFERIREVQPKQLFVAADGPRPDRPEEAKKCEEVRKIATEVDWDCEVKTLFRDENLGCGKAVSEGITWFFEHVEAGIILEDDCLPNESFFSFCGTLLDHYFSNNSVMMISGSNFQFGKARGKASYYFSYQAHIWGWATWRRAWSEFTYELVGLDEFLVQDKIGDYVLGKREQTRWKTVFLDLRENKIDTWDYRWQYTIWKNNGVAVLPNYNLITNIGFGEEATHTKKGEDVVANQVAVCIQQISHPVVVKPDMKADKYTVDYLYRQRNSMKERIKAKSKSLLSDSIAFVKYKSIVKPFK